jgi:hypothetical protein
MEEKNKCANCLRELDIGVDAIQVSEGVMGMKGFVPLEKTFYFCRDDCLSGYYDVSNLPSMPKRIP